MSAELDRAEAPRRFVILCLGRTGSTHLQSMLDFHSQARCFGELFGDGEPPTFATSGHSDPAAFLEDLLAGIEERAVGFKLPMNSIRAEPGAAELVRRDGRIAAIRLSRRNRLAQLVSRRLLAATGVSQSIFGAYGEAMVQIEPRECIAAFERMEADEDELDALCVGRETFRIDYEELGDETRLEALQRFLGIEPEALRSWYTKLRNRPLRETVSNWDDLVAALADTRFASYLDE